MTPATSTPSASYQLHPEIQGANQGVLWGTDERGPSSKKYYYQIDDKIYVFKSEDDRNEFLDIVAQEVDVAACDPDFQNAARRFAGQHRDELGDGRFDRSETWERFKAPYQSAYLGRNVPHIPYESGEFFSHPPTFGESGSVIPARRAGIIKTARVSYDHNYGRNVAFGTNEQVPLTGGKHTKIEPMISEIWPDQLVTQGRLNILLQMALISIVPNSTPPQFELTGLGEGFLNPPDYATNGIPEFFPSVNLLAPETEDFPHLPDNSPAQTIENAAKQFYSSLGSTPEGWLADIKTSDSTGSDIGESYICALINNLLHIDPPIGYLTHATPSQLNTAIALGLLSVDNDVVCITSKGGNYLGLIQAPAETYDNAAVSSTVPSIMPRLMFLYGLGKAFDNVEHTINTDWLPDNGLFWLEGIYPISQTTADNENFWHQIGLGDIPKTQRQAIIDVAKFYMENWGSGDPNNRIPQRLEDVSDSSIELNKQELERQAVDLKEFYTGCFNETQFSDFPSAEKFMMSEKTAGVLNQICTDLLGKPYEQMMPEEKKQAIYTMTNKGILSFSSPVYSDGHMVQRPELMLIPGIPYPEPGFVRI